MDKKNIFSALGVAFGAQSLIFLCSSLMTLAVPKIMGVRSFAYWQLFIFYSGYVNIFQFGLSDGVYLRYGGKTRKNANKSDILSQSLVCFIMQLIVGILVAIISLKTCDERDRLFVLLSISIYLVLSNIGYYWGYVFQALNETKLFSFSQALDRVCFLVPLLFLIFARCTNFKFYILLTIATKLIAVVYTFVHAREFFLAKPFPFSRSLKLAFASMEKGVFLTAATLSSSFIVGLARLAIDARWGIESFGKMSLSFSLINFALAFMTQGSMVLFPAIRQASSKQYELYYSKIRNSLAVILPLIYLLYFPMYYVMCIWLPQYKDSFSYLVYLMPICIFEAQTNLAIVTFFKVRNEVGKLLITNLTALAFAAAGVCFAAWILNDPTFVVLFTTAGIIVRYIVGDFYLSNSYHTFDVKLTVSQVLLAFLFGWAVNLNAGILPILICFVAILVYELVFKNYLQDTFSFIR